MDINFELYKIFYYCATEKSFSTAAKRLYITQSAVSQAIKGLEKQLGVSLFIRNARSIQLTKEAELLYSYVSQAYNYLKTAESKLIEMDDLSAGDIRIGVSDSICKYFLMPYIKKFNQQYPKILVKVINRTTPQLYGVLKDGLADFIIATPPQDNTNYSYKKFASVEDIFVAVPHKYPNLKNSQISLSELNKYPLILLDSESSTRKLLNSFFEENGLTCNAEIELESLELVIEFARIGTGIAYVLRESAQQYIENSELFEIVPAKKPPKRELGVVTNKKVVPSKAVTTFLESL